MLSDLQSFVQIQQNKLTKHESQTNVTLKAYS